MHDETVVVTAIFKPVPGVREELVERLRVAIAEVHEEPGCLLYAIHGAPDGSIVMIEKWENERLLDEHAAGEPVQRLDASIAGLITAPVEVTRLRPIAAGRESQGRL